MALGEYSFIVRETNDGQPLKTFLRRECGITARSLSVLKNSGMGITCGSSVLRVHDAVHTGDRIELHLPKEVNDITPVEGTPDVLYEDAYLLIVNKPAGMPVHPTKIHQLDTLANVVSFYQAQKGESYVFRSLNRLDKDTSGCVIIAKDRIAYALVQPTVHKTYFAVCEGQIAKDGVVDVPIGLADGSKIRRCVRKDGAEAITHYHPVCYGNGHTLCELWLETGRTHQIRCHMSALGHPLAGDDLYGGSLKYIQRQALHCKSVTLLHPASNEEIHVDTPLPSAFPAILKIE